MPNPDDGVLAYAYLRWVGQAPEQRMGTLPNDDVVIRIPGPPETPAFPPQTVNLGEALHSFLDPANPGAGEQTAIELRNTNVPVQNLEGLGWHIHPKALNQDQRAKWFTPQDTQDAVGIYRLFNEGRTTRGYLPVWISKIENAKRAGWNREPDWSVTIRIRLHHNRGGTASLGPAAVWALIDNAIPVIRSQREGFVQIHPRAPTIGQKAAREMGEKRGRNIRAMYEWGIIPPEHVPPYGPRAGSAKAIKPWAKQTLDRLADLARAKSKHATSEEPEIAALKEAGKLTLVATDSGKSYKISAENTEPIANIVAALTKLPPELRDHGPDGPPQQNQLGEAEFAPQPSASYQQPQAPHQPFVPPAPPPAPTWAGAASAFSPPATGGYEYPSSATQPVMPSLTPQQQQTQQTRGQGQGQPRRK
ncbi:hypothetical protein ACQEU8_03760 [Streptomyces sp. CA-250714]|uniref:hypothetical protein n=1 Tax=Streptomyces sp. CA-250714 TaxID=3240060 RepID=UPI003D923998